MVARRVAPLIALLLVAPACSSSSRAPVRTAPVVPLSRLEGVYRDGSRTFVVTYQGWWLDLASQALRQLQPSAGGGYSYGPGFMQADPVQGELRFHLAAGGAPDRRSEERRVG